MINQRELTRLSSDWMNQVSSDLSNLVIDILEQTGYDEEQLATYLGVRTEDISNIINGCRDMNVSLLAKLLIASNHCIVIKSNEEMPLRPRGDVSQASRMTPMGRMRGNMPPMGRMRGNMPPMGRMRGNMPPMDRTRIDMPNIGDERDDMSPMGRMRDEMPPMGRMRGNIPNMEHEKDEMPPIPPMGRMRGNMSPMGRMRDEMPPMNQSRLGNQIPTMNEVRNEMPIGENIESRRRLVETIINNRWDNEVDIINSTENELKEFILNKNNSLRQPEAARQPEVSRSRVDELVERIKAEAARNPQIAEIIDSLNV